MNEQERNAPDFPFNSDVNFRSAPEKRKVTLT